MRAVQFSRYGGPEVLQVVELPDPHPGPDQIRIAVRAAAVSATDPKIRSGEISFGATLPQGLGRDVAGVVDEIGSDVSGVEIGDRVFGYSDGEGIAEHTLLTAFAPVPSSLGFIDAAAIPVALETATRALDQLGVTASTTLLINGASGGIGSTAVQLAVARGARVIGTASAANQGWLTLLGAEPVIYGAGMVERVRALAPDGADRALDVAGNGVLADLVDLAGGEKHVVTLADPSAAELGVHFSNGYTDGQSLGALMEVGALIDRGAFWLPVDRTFRMDEIAEAHRVISRGGIRGRLVLIVSSD